ncbi:MAG: glycosyltransferase family 2 protein [Pseudonocardia sp.]
MRPQLSVIVPIHQGRAQVLRSALTSILQQSLGFSESLEVIVVQDGNDDGASEVVESFKNLRIEYMPSDGSCGISASRNRGIKSATSPLVLLLDSDDFLTASCVETLLSFAEKESSSGVYYSNSQRFYERDGISLGLPIISDFYHRMYEKHRKSRFNPFFHSVFVGHAIAVRRELLIEIGGFNENKLCGELTDLVLKIHMSGARFTHIPRKLYMYRRSSNGRLLDDSCIHSERADSIARSYREYFDDTLLDVVPLGRVAPYQHYHYLLRGSDDQEITPDYVNYPSMRLRLEGIMT